MIEAPPSRYRVVERDRRLVVIDRASGQEWAATPQAAERPMTAPKPGRHASSLGGMEKLRFDGGGEFTTHALYDAHGPRTIALDAVSAAMVSKVRTALLVGAMIAVVAAIAEPLVLVALPLLAFQPKLREAARMRMTRWFDAREAGRA